MPIFMQNKNALKKKRKTQLSKESYSEHGVNNNWDWRFAAYMGFLKDFLLTAT